MKTSESIANIAEALAKAQAEIANPVKDRTARVKSDKADYTYNYADLANVLDAVRPPLAKHGIAIVQAPAVAGAVLTMTTRLIHSSGEWIEAELSSEVDPSAKIQTLGSAITYLRRYSLQAIVGVVAEEDDDGNAAQGNRAQTEQRPAARAASAPAPVQRPPAAKPAPAAPATAAKPPTAKERFDTACDAINERLGSKAGHELIMSIKNKHGGDGATNDQKLLVIADLERTLTGEAVLPLATAAP